MDIWRNHPLWLEWVILKPKLSLILTSSSRRWWLNSVISQIKYRIFPLLHPKRWLY